MRKRFIISALFALCLSGAAIANPENVKCTKEPGFLAGPVVPTERAAKEIYIAIARALYPRTWRRYPTIFVLDEGDTWGVGQKTADVPDKKFKNKSGAAMERITVTHGGGDLEMEISKCDASAKLSFSR